MRRTEAVSVDGVDHIVQLITQHKCLYHIHFCKCVVYCKERSIITAVYLYSCANFATFGTASSSGDHQAPRWHAGRNTIPDLIEKLNRKKPSARIRKQLSIVVVLRLLPQCVYYSDKWHTRVYCSDRCVAFIKLTARPGWCVHYELYKS